MTRIDNNVQSTNYVNTPTTTTKTNSNTPVSVFDKNNNGIVDKEDLQGITVEHSEYGKIDLAELCEGLNEVYNTNILGSLWSKLKDKFSGSDAIKDKSGNIIDYKTDYINPETNQKMSVLDICAELVKFNDKRNAERGRSYAINEEVMGNFASTSNIPINNFTSSRMGNFQFFIDEVYSVAFPGTIGKEEISIENTLTGEIIKIPTNEFYEKYKIQY